MFEAGFAYILSKSLMNTRTKAQFNRELSFFHLYLNYLLTFDFYGSTIKKNSLR